MERSPHPTLAFFQRGLYRYVLIEERWLHPILVVVLGVFMLFGLTIYVLGVFASPGSPSVYLLGLELFAPAYAIWLLVIVLRRTTGASAGYVSYVASLAGSVSGRSHFPLDAWNLHVTGLRRLGNRISGGNIDDALYLARSEGSVGKRPPGSFAEVMRAIELGLVEESAPLAGDRRAEPLARYAEEMAIAFFTGPFTLETWRRFLLSKYWKLPKSCRIRSRSQIVPTRLSQLEASLEAHGGIVYVVLALAQAVVVLIAALIASLHL